MDKPFQAYQGDAPYLFVCYAHADKALVYPEMVRLKEAGFNIWYDEGISPGSEFSNIIASHIEGCAAFVYFVTPRANASEYCRREVSFATEQHCELLTVHLEPTELESGLKLTLNNRQAILKYDEPPSVYESKLVQALGSIMNMQPIRRETPNEARAPKGSRMLLAFSMVVVLALISVSGIYYYNRPAEPMQASEVNAEGPPAAIAEKSIAVLPFINLSSDPEQEYFADGLTEELLNKLAQVHDLKVTARTSSFFYKDKKINVQEVGRTLGVAHLLEGSVRKSGDQLRITAQLINTTDGFHLWSESFDRPLSDVFAIQDEIAEKVTTTLSITLGAGEFDRPGMTNNIEAYDAYLRSNSSTDNILAGIEHAERAVKLDPNFGMGWLRVAEAFGIGLYGLPQDQTGGFLERQQEAIAQANAVAGNSPEVRAVNAIILLITGNYLETERLFLELHDEHRIAALTLISHADLKALVGRPEESIPLLRRAQRLDPLSDYISYLLALVLTYTGKFDEGLAEAERGMLLETGRGYTAFHLIKWFITLQTGDRFAVADAIAETMGNDDPRVPGLKANDIGAARAWARDYANDPATPLLDKAFTIHLAAMLGDPELALEILLQYPFWAQGADGPLWMDHMRDMRQLAGFKGFLRNYGIYDYWVGTGNWAHQCRPLADREDDFECF